MEFILRLLKALQASIICEALAKTFAVHKKQRNIEIYAHKNIGNGI